MEFDSTVAFLTRRIGLALGEEPVDLLLKNTRLVNVLSGDIHEADIAVSDGVVVGFGDYEARQVVDCQGRYACPGLIDGHIHIESTLLTPWEFARAAAPRGTCAVVWDPHEIANVLGRQGIEDMLANTERCPLTFFIMASSCVPATTMETSGAAVTAEDIAWLVQRHHDRVLGLAELMNYPGLLAKDPSVLAKIAACHCAVIDGHAPLVSGKALNAYVLAGPSSDHECTDLDEALEKLRKGMHLFMREGSDEKNLADLIAAVNPHNAQNISMVCDDRDPFDLTTNGHMDHNVRMAVRLGVDPLRAVQMASINTARHFGMRGRGAVAPGYRADVVLLDDLEEFRIWKCFLAGEEVPPGGFAPQGRVTAVNTVCLSTPGGRLGAEDFAIIQVKDEVRCIGVIPGQIVTKSVAVRPRMADGFAHADPAQDLAKLAVVERHGKGGHIALGFMQGLGMARGAIAGTVAHDSHNLVVAGVCDEDMALAGNVLAEAGGGYCVVADGEVLALLKLPYAGLMSLKPLEYVVRDYERLRAAFTRVALNKANYTHPFMALSFSSLPVIPELKLTDKGLVDVNRFEVVDLWL
ncbi:Adenine deaminase [Fundidesulfovibrio magnetotacticus]|uniref:Adenine deaminase n=1 Tax=Fundidesulfovibrio magnetotacticus TaxID=2730080 RepID=A0A6V8LY82_9BACT|nr:adenine deaminase [Fundidesulfovibrio magnetotacticus]GFK95551.1 Adenine deaminase [Fundidesulfovibrio magnetotacticus]